MHTALAVETTGTTGQTTHTHTLGTWMLRTGRLHEPTKPHVHRQGELRVNRLQLDTGPSHYFQNSPPW